MTGFDSSNAQITPCYAVLEGKISLSLLAGSTTLEVGMGIVFSHRSNSSQTPNSMR